MSGTRGISVRYSSCTALDRDHAAYMAHGGLVVPFDGAGVPDPNTRLVIRIEVTGGPAFELVGRVGQTIPGRGFMVTFEEESRPAQAALDTFVQDPRFQAVLQQERIPSPAPPWVTLLLPEEALTPLPSLPEEALTPLPSPPEATPAAASPAEEQGQEELLPFPATDLAADLNLHEDSKDELDFDEDPEAELEFDESLGDELDSGQDPGEPPWSASEEETSSIRRPKPGEAYWVFVLKFTTLRAYVEHTRGFAETRKLRIPDPRESEDIHAHEVARIRLTLPGHNVFEMWGVIEDVAADSVEVRVSENDEQFRKAILHPESVAGQKRLEREQPEDQREIVTVRLRQEVPVEDLDKMPIRRRLQRMGMDDKINLALSGNREERMALATDSNKAVHHYLLKNAKITLDEIAFMARLPSLNPDVLDKIAENPSFVQNPTVVKALVYNPKTPVRTAIRLLDRLPRPEVLNLSKRMTMNRRLVMAAKKKIERSK